MVAILGVLAAVVIPNVGRFLGRGKTEAAGTELANIQSAVVSMMVDNQLASLPNPVESDTNRTQDMSAFPDTTAAASKGYDTNGVQFVSGDGDGWVLYQCDRTGGGDTINLTNYVATSTASYWYTCDASGTVTQFDTAP